MSFWSEVAREFRVPVVLKTTGLGAKFEVQFVQGWLVLRLANKVERRVDLPEFRAAWRLLDGNAPPEVLRLATANGPYLAAVRERLVQHAISFPDGGEDGSDEVSALETALVTQATAMAAFVMSAGPGRPALDEPGADGAPRPADADQALVEQRDTLARENARLQATLSELESVAVRESERADSLARELETNRASVARPPTVGPQADAVVIYLKHIEPTLGHGTIDDVASESLRSAGRSLAGNPSYAAIECRKLIEHVARRAWLKTFGAEQLPSQAGFGSLMTDLRDQPGVDMRRWNLAKTMFGVASEAAHVGSPAPSTERALMILLAAYELRAGLIDLGR